MIILLTIVKPVLLETLSLAGFEETSGHIGKTHGMRIKPATDHSHQEMPNSIWPASLREPIAANGRVSLKVDLSSVEAQSLRQQPWPTGRLQICETLKWGPAPKQSQDL